MVYMVKKNLGNAGRLNLSLPEWLIDRHQEIAGELSAALGREVNYSELAMACLFWMQTQDGPAEQLERFRWRTL